MKAIKIEKLLKKMIENFCESITDESIVFLIKNHSFIAGGCIPSMLSDEWINDFDIYLDTEEHVKQIQTYFEHIKDKKLDKFSVSLITENSINFKDKIQIITKFYGTPEEVVSKFDWAHIKSYYKYPDTLVINDNVYKLIVEKELIYTGSDYPMSSIMRLKKYIKKGWTVSNTTILHICLDLIEAFRNPVKKFKENNINLKDLGISSVYPGIIEFSTEQDYEHKFNVDEVLYHLNGIDPLTIQQELVEKTGQYLTINEILNLIKNNN